MKNFNQVQGYPGSAPGIEHSEIHGLPGGGGEVNISCYDYCPDQFSFQEVSNFEDFLGLHRPEWTAVRWINITGLSDMRVLSELAVKYNLHPLAIEDVLAKNQRPKFEAFGGEGSEHMARLFLVTHALRMIDGRLQHDQVSIFLGHKTVITFRESQSTEWETIRQRIRVNGSRLRNTDASFLAYSLLDAIMDSCFPILETFSDRAEELEAVILDRLKSGLINEIHLLKYDILKLRWVVWPMREVVSSLQREPHECISEITRVYLQDLYDHVIQVIDLIETYREISSDLTDTYISSVSNRMNEIMKVLTLIGTIFIPLTFLAGVYGMNFKYFPELDKTWAYPAFWGICFATAALMLIMFRRRRWL